MAKPSNMMSEDDLLSALGIAPEASEEQPAKSAELNADALVDVFVTGKPSSERYTSSSRSSSTARRTSRNSAEREAQLKEKSLRSREWKRELERQQERTQAFSRPLSQYEDEDTSKSQEVIRVKAQPIIPNSSDMGDIENAVGRAASQHGIADEELERRRQEMRAQISHRQAQVAKQAQVASQAAQMRQQSQASQARQQHQPVAHQVPPTHNPKVVRQQQQSAMHNQPQPRSAQPAPSDMRQMQQPPRSVAPENAQPRQSATPGQMQAKGVGEIRRAEKRGRQSEGAPKESPVGIVLIVLAVLCVLVAASLLTGLWDISNL